MGFGLFGSGRGPRRAAAQSRPRRPASGHVPEVSRRRRLRVTALEDRRLLSGAPFAGLEELGLLAGEISDAPPLAADSEPVLAGAAGPVYPTNYEQYLVELINRARANPAAEAARYGIDLNEGLAAGTISTAAKQPLALNPYIVNAARGHSQWMIDNDVFSHTGAGGSTPGGRMTDAGYAFVSPWSWGENIAWTGTTGSSLPPTSTTASLHEALFVDLGVDGRGHRLNLMNSSFREIGAGIAFGNFSGYNAEMVTEDFAYSGSSRFLTGVAYDDRLVSRDFFYTPGEGLGSVTITARRASDGATFTASTWSSGGYSLALSAGTYTVTASGGGLAGTVTVQSVVIGTLNVKVDFTTDMLSGNRPPTADAGGPYTVAEGGTVTLNGSRSSDPDQSAASLIYEWDLDGDGTFGEQGAGALRGNETGMNPVFSAAGLDGPSARTVSLRVVDSTGAPSSVATAQVAVVNAAPAITQLSLSPQLGRANQAVQLTITFTDPGTPDRHTAQINWGQGTPQSVSVTAGARSLTVSHVYTTDGVYSAAVTVTDDDAGSSGSTPLTVVIKSGDVAGPHAYVLGNGVSIASGDATPGAADFTDFGWVHELLPGTTRTFIVANDGTQTLFLESLTLPAGFTLVEGLPSSLASRTWDAFTVRLDTAARGTFGGNISFLTNRADQRPFTFAVTGTVGPLAAPYSLTAAATSATSVQLAWQNPGGVAERFTIDRKTEDLWSDWGLRASLGAGDATWQDAALSPYVAYHYRLVGYNAAGNPGWDEIKAMLDAAGNLYTLGKDNWLRINGAARFADTRDFLVLEDGTLYWLGTGGVFERTRDGTAWERLDTDAVRFNIDSGGIAYSVGADHWLNREGRPVWTGTQDYRILPDRTVYWLGTGGIFERLNRGDYPWQRLDTDAVTYAIDGRGIAYSVGKDHWLNKEGRAVWTDTQDYYILPDGTIYWLGTGGIFERLAPGASSWQRLDTDAVSFQIDSGGTAYSWGWDHWLNRDGRPVWANTQAYRAMPDRSIYWLGTTGIFERLPYGASSWQRLDLDAVEVVFRDAWVAYSRGKDKWVNYEGTPTWEGVDDVYVDAEGCLVLVRPAGNARLTGSLFEQL